MSRRRDHIIERFEAWWKIANKSLGLFVENVEKDRCVGSISGNQFHFLLMKLRRDPELACVPGQQTMVDGSRGEGIEC
jgi:hypothetical protein